MITFRVDDVTPAPDRLPTRPLGELFPDALVVGGDPTAEVLEPDGVQPLLSAVGRAFAEHRPLVLSPDAVWLTIAQGVAQHVRLNAEELRPVLVTHAGRKRLSVTLDGPMPHDASTWRDVVDVFGEQLAAEVDHADVFECDFSTSTDVERVAARIVLLDVYSPYFALWLECVCGIPSITLTGTVEDWRRIRARIDALAVFGLEEWRRSLVPIADHLVRAAEGDADTAFWQRIYNPRDAYGGRVVTGWAARFYPYLTWLSTTDQPNPLLALEIGEPRDVTVDHHGYNGPGISGDSVPATLSQVVVTVTDQHDNRAVALHAGLVGVAQDEDGALRPIAGWQLAPAQIHIEDLIDRIVRDHTTEPPQESMPPFDLGADVAAVYQRIGSATLFDGAWKLLPIARHRRAADGYVRGIILIAIIGNRALGAVTYVSERTVHWIVCRVAQGPERALLLVDDPADIPVYGTSFALLLEAALDSGGDISHLETGRLAELNARTPRFEDLRRAHPSD